jgi:K+-sensing histidine kinase KdpD
MTDETGVRFGLASGALVLALLVAAALPLDLGETAVIALVTAAAASATLPRLFAVVLGLEAWAYFTGFFENRYGVLTLTSHDLLTLAAFVAVTVVMAAVVRDALNGSKGVRDE